MPSRLASPIPGTPLRRSGSPQVLPGTQLQLTVVFIFSNRTTVTGTRRTMKANAPSRAHVVSRVLASLVGGYAFVWGFTTLTTVAGVLAGMAYEGAQTLAYLVAFLVYLGCFLWAFAASNLFGVWLTLGGGGAALTGAAWLLARFVA